MTRGRRPDAGLEPSRQLLTQRAFRQRRAAHLADLEEKIVKLEKENALLKGIEYVEQERGERGTPAKRIKSEASDGGSQSRGWSEAHDENGGIGREGSSSYCEMCAVHEKEKQDLMKAVAVVDGALFTLSEAMHNLRQSVSQQSDTRMQSHLPPAPATFGSRPSNVKHKQVQSNTSLSSSDSSAFASSSSSDMLNVPLPTSTTSTTATSSIGHLKRSSFDEQLLSTSSPVSHSLGQTHKNRASSAVAAAAASARSAGTANTTCTPSAGDCCSKQSNPPVEAIPAPRIAHQHALPIHPAVPLAVSRHRIVNAPVKANSALGLGQFDVDESKCCLGLFECDSDGNFIAN